MQKQRMLVLTVVKLAELNSGTPMHGSPSFFTLGLLVLFCMLSCEKQPYGNDWQKCFLLELHVGVRS